MKRLIIILFLLPLLSFGQLGQYLGARSATTKLLLHLNGNSTDASGNANNGTDSNITYGLNYGKFNKGAGFNGSSSKMTFSNSSGQFNLLHNNYTISFWIYPISNDLLNTSVLNMGQHIGGNKFYEIAATGTFVSVLLYNGAGYKYVLAYNFPSSKANTWYYATFVFDGTNTKIYLNGAEVGTSSESYLSTDMPLNQTLNIGAMVDHGTWYYQRLNLDEIIIENRAWIASEVKKYFTYSKARFGID